MENTSRSTARLAVLGLLLALTVALSFFEHMLPPIPGLPPGVRLGLANIVTMYTVIALGKGEAAGLAAAKSLFVALTRGASAGMLSICGGMLAILAMILSAALSRGKISRLLMSVFGAVAHNLGQLAAASVLLGSAYALYYAPVLIVAGVAAGCLTGFLLRAVAPLFARMSASAIKPPEDAK